MEVNDDSHPLNPGGGDSQGQGIDNTACRSYDSPSEVTQDSIRDSSFDTEATIHSSDASSDTGAVSRPHTSHDLEMVAVPLMRDDEQSDGKQSLEEDPNYDPDIDSSDTSYSLSEYAEEKGCCPEWFTKKKDALIKGFRKLKKRCQPFIDGCINFFKIVAKLGPMIMAVISINLLTFDQYTDGSTAKTVCEMPCTCVWNRNPENITTELFKKNEGICEGAGDSKENGTCYDAFGNEDLIARYCNPIEDPKECNEEIDGWKSNGWWRHPSYCSVTIATILGSSILTSSFLLYKLRELYIPMLIYLRWDPKKHAWLFQMIYILIHGFWLLQILPHVWIIMTFCICLEAWRQERKQIIKEKKSHTEETEVKEWEWDEREDWDQSNRNSKIIFAIFEDTPQLTLHSMFIVNSAVKEERVLVFSGLDYLGISFYVGAITSAVSMALAVTLYKQLPETKDKAMQFLSSVLAVGSRAFICACYASTINEEFLFKTWTLMLPPATSLGLFIIDKFVSKLIASLCTHIKACKGNTKHRKRNINKHSNSTRKWKKDHWKSIKDQPWNYCKEMLQNLWEKLTSAVVSLVFEGNSVESLIPAYTYLAFAVILNTMWVSEKSETTKLVLRNIQNLSLASVLINLFIVQVEGKHKVRCLIYSLLFLLYLGIFHHYLQIGFKELKKLYFTDKAIDRIEKNEMDFYINQTLDSLNSLLIITGITSLINLLLKIASLIRDCYIDALIPDRNNRRYSRQEVNSDIEMNVR